MKKNIQPPKLASKLLGWYCRNAMIEDLEGDLEEIFNKNVRTHSIASANYHYWRQVVSLLFSYAIQRRKKDKRFHFFSTNSFNAAMLKNYFIIASRNLAKHKFFTIINILGLAVGMSISLLIIAMISFVSTYDNFHVNKDSIFRVITYVKEQQQSAEYASAPSQLSTHLENIAGVQHVVRINANLSGEATYDNRTVPIRGYFADAEFLTRFTFPMLKGNVSRFRNPFTLVITESYAKKLFSDEDPIGKVIRIENIGDFEVTGVMQDIPKNSHMQFEAVASFATLETFEHTPLTSTWTDFHNSYVYFETEEKNRDVIQAGLNKAASQHYTDPHFQVTFHTQALPDIEPGMELNNQIGPEWGYIGFSIFGLLTLLILLPACFNYANISISRALKRMKEIGLRKVMGGQQRQIFFQFITETIIVTLIALVLSYFLFSLVKTEFLAMLVDSSALELDPDGRTIGLFVAFALLVGFGAGFVPAVYFARLNPIQALKSKSLSQTSRFSIRKIITVAQFALSIGFIMGVVIIFNQYRQVIHHNFGFSKDNIVNVDLQNVDAATFKYEFLQLNSVHGVSMSSNIMGTSAMPAIWIKEGGHSDSTEVNQMFIDNDFIANHGLTLIKGEDFTDDDGANRHAIIVNEQFSKQLTTDSSSILGKTFQISDSLIVVVKGVVADFHYAHLSMPIKPFAFRYDPKEFKVANVKLVPTEDIFSTVSKMEAIWKKLDPNNKFQSKFLSDEINDSYDFYFSMIKICGYLGLLAITISCLGMLGMVVFTVENKVKEIGVRKVMGATTAHITYLLSKEFGKLLLVAAMIATPITYVLFDMYLQRQYVKMEIGVTEIIISLLLVMGLGLAAILSQTWRAARANPVETLRTE